MQLIAKVVVTVLPPVLPSLQIQNRTSKIENRPSAAVPLSIRCYFVCRTLFTSFHHATNFQNALLYNILHEKSEIRLTAAHCGDCLSVCGRQADVAELLRERD